MKIVAVVLLVADVGCVCEFQLHVAACNGYVRVMEFLLSHGAIISSLDNDGWQPLHCAVCWGQVSQLLLCGHIAHLCLHPSLQS